MSDFVSRDMVPDLWSEILNRHWTFLDTEESIQKLEERKKLDGCLKEFLCVVPHNRKFFLPETAVVLRKSIVEMENFSAFNAIIGFESISQYANNLFTKPWRKEFRVLKMYSGFFQHEIKSNLVDAEKLFEAMGYRQLSDDVLILDGPICPDQVTNVSRDAMVAYVECQIIKNIYTGLVAMGLACTWQDVLQYRENYTGGSSQAIKAMAYLIQERRLRKENLINPENYYASIQHSPQISQYALPKCQNCAPYHMSQSYLMQTQPHNGQCAVHNNSGYDRHAKAVLQANAMCNGNKNKMISSYPITGYHQQQDSLIAPGIHPHMSHSRSLEHYNEPPVPLPHRHSFDHQQQGCTSHHYQQPYQHQLPQHIYETPHDCLDGASAGSSASYAAIASAGVNPTYSHPYNVSGNRYPLPLHISNQLNTQCETAAGVTCNGVKGDPYSNVNNSYVSVNKSHNYHPQSPLPPTRQNLSSAAATADFQSNRQRSFPPDHHLIDFDDQAPLTSHDFHAQLHSMSFDYDRGRRTMNPTYSQPNDTIYHHGTGAPLQIPLPDSLYDNNLYAYPTPRGRRTTDLIGSNNRTDKYLRNSDILPDCIDNNRKMQKELRDHLTLNGGGSDRRKQYDRHTSDGSNDSTLDDFVNVEHNDLSKRSPSQAVKNQDGVGSFETWNYVFQNLEKSGYSKDLGDRGDLLVQSLNLDLMNISNGATNNLTEKRRSSHIESSKSGRQPDKLKALEKPQKEIKHEDKTYIKQEKSILKQQNTNNIGGGGSKKTKSVLKPAVITPIVIENNNSMSRIKEAKANRQSVNTIRSANRQVPVSTQVIVSGPNEWSCRTCTFLNPNTKRICEMCSRSKDFNIEASVSNTPTCV